jgi:hypothetical protein
MVQAYKTARVIAERYGSKQIIIRAKNEKCDCGRSAQSMQSMRVSRRCSLGQRSTPAPSPRTRKEPMPHMPEGHEPFGGKP